MKHSLFALCGWLLPFVLSAQFFPPIQGTFTEVACPYNDTLPLTQSTVYEFYRTVDDTYAGEIDSSWCADFDQVGSDFGLDLNSLGDGRALFVSISFPQGQGPQITTYQQHELNQFMWLDDAILRTGDSCAGEFCSGYFLEYDYIDEVTLQAGSRQFAFALDGETTYPEEAGVTCFFSERFTLQRLRSLTFKISPEVTGESPRLKPVSLQLLEAWDDSQLIESVTYGPENYYPLTDSYGAFAESVVQSEEPWNPDRVMYTPQVEDTIPGPNNFRYTDVEIVPNSDSTKNIFLDFWAESTVNFPPYSGLRGGLVAGSDSLRHNLTIDFLDGSLLPTCFGIVVEVIAPANVTYRYADGIINLANKNSCFQVQKGGAFAVAQNGQLQYGRPGSSIGLFATKPEGWVKLESGSQLTVNANWQLAHPPNDPEAGSHVDLQAGSRLVFGKNASLFRSHPEGAGYLYVHLNGGSINVEALPADERALIRYVYPEELNLQKSRELLTVYPNPARNYLQVVIPEDLTGRQLEMVLFDAMGRRIFSTQKMATDRLFSTSLPTNFPNGIYRLLLTDGQSTKSAKVRIVD